MIGYCYSSETKEFVGVVDLQLDPLESKKADKNIYMYPPNTTLTKPPTFTDKQFIRFIDGKWIVENIPEPEKQPEPKPPTEEELLIQQEEQMIYNETRKIAIERLGDKLTVVKK